MILSLEFYVRLKSSGKHKGCIMANTEGIYYYLLTVESSCKFILDFSELVCFLFHNAALYLKYLSRSGL